MRFLTKKVCEFEAQNAVLFLYEDVDLRSDFYNRLNELSSNELEKQIYRYKTTKRTFLEIFKYSINENLKVFVVGLGKKSAFTRKKFSQFH